MPGELVSPKTKTHDLNAMKKQKQDTLIKCGCISTGTYYCKDNQMYNLLLQAQSNV